MAKILGFFFLSLYAAPLFAVSMNFTGTYRTEGTFLDRPTLDLSGTTLKYISTRALLQPSLVVDDHFSVKSQWNLIRGGTDPSKGVVTPIGPTPAGLSVGQGGYVLGDPNLTTFSLGRAWLEWTSDFGVFRVGRMPVSWGYGLTWDAGSGVWDDYQTTLDRVEYRLQLGTVVGGIAYSKALKIAALAENMDQEFYTIYLQYQNPETDTEGGILYEKQQRPNGIGATLMGEGNPLRVPIATGGTHPYALSNKSPYPLRNDVLDVYLKKKIGYFTFGGEVTWLRGETADFDGNGTFGDLNAIGAMVSATLEYHRLKAFVEVVYASGDNAINSDRLQGFVLLHRNRRAGIILGRQYLGATAGNYAGIGSPVLYGQPDGGGNAQSFPGVLYARPGIRIDWSRNWASGLEAIYAQKAAVVAGESANLGIELDLGTEYAVYKNFDLGLTLGYLFPGAGLLVASPQGVFGAQASAVLKF